MSIPHREETQWEQQLCGRGREGGRGRKAEQISICIKNTFTRNTRTLTYFNGVRVGVFAAAASAGVCVCVSNQIAAGVILAILAFWPAWLKDFIDAKHVQSGRQPRSG